MNLRPRRIPRRWAAPARPAFHARGGLKFLSNKVQRRRSKRKGEDQMSRKGVVAKSLSNWPPGDCSPVYSNRWPKWSTQGPAVAGPGTCSSWARAHRSVQTGPCARVRVHGGVHGGSCTPVRVHGSVCTAVCMAGSCRPVRVRRSVCTAVLMAVRAHGSVCMGPCVRRCS